MLRLLSAESIGLGAVGAELVMMFALGLELVPIVAQTEAAVLKEPCNFAEKLVISLKLHFIR
jgi:hypothetical protein